MSSPVEPTGSFIPLELLDAIGAEPLDARDSMYWGADPFDIVALIEEELGAPIITLKELR